jgi:tricorn protease-like protein
MKTKTSIIPRQPGESGFDHANCEVKKRPGWTTKSGQDHSPALDSDLARVYGLTTKRLNQAADFAFQFTNEEVAILRSQFVTSSSTFVDPLPGFIINLCATI